MLPRLWRWENDRDRGPGVPGSGSLGPASPTFEPCHRMSQPQPVPSGIEPAVGTKIGNRGRVDDPRVYLAAERTFLAWVRTSLALMGFGFLIARFTLLFRLPEGQLTPHVQAEPPAVFPWLGFGMVCFGVAVCVVSLVRHRAYIQALESGVPNPPSDARAPLIVAAVLALVGLAMAVHILTF